MPSIVEQLPTSRKRKRLEVKSSAVESASSVNGSVHKVPQVKNLREHISQLEARIGKSQKHYNDIVSLYSIATQLLEDDPRDQIAVAALCRVHSRLVASGKLTRDEASPEKDRILADWLRDRYRDYHNLLLRCIRNGQEGLPKVALLAAMTLYSPWSASPGVFTESSWHTGIVLKLIHSLLESTAEGDLQLVFAKMYAQKFDDIRHSVFSCIVEQLNKQLSPQLRSTIAANSLKMLSAIEVVEERELDRLMCNGSEDTKHKKLALSAHRKRAQQAWLAVMSSGLNKEQRKVILSSMGERVVPWFQNVELLMDFLTDSFDAGGATSLLSLSGLFHLMQEKNLDCPGFYTKLYSLLDANVLHSKHRSRFLRLLNIFTSSSHLPAAMVASFIKRLSRLALCAPPAGIVAVVPWIYNMLKTHPTCTFMIHREPRDTDEKALYEEEGTDDPFDMNQSDPMQTDALESSLWELETLQSHYHPNVASLARIISEQFLKNAFNLEDFLNHSYSSLIEAEFSKDMNTPPVVEFQIPKTIFTQPGEDQPGALGRIMLSILEDMPA